MTRKEAVEILSFDFTNKASSPTLSETTMILAGLSICVGGFIFFKLCFPNYKSFTARVIDSPRSANIFRTIFTPIILTFSFIILSEMKKTTEESIPVAEKQVGLDQCVDEYTKINASGYLPLF